MVDLSGYSDEQLRQLQQQLPPSTQGAPAGSFATAPIPPDLSKYSDEQLRQMREQLPSAQGTPQIGPVAAAQGWYGQLNAAFQRTSPVVRDAQGNLNYNRLGDSLDTDAGPGYVDNSGKLQRINPEKHVMLTDPATGKMTVFERSDATNESMATSLARVLSFGMLPGSATVPVASGGPSVTANILSSPVTKTLANVGVGAVSGLLGEHFGLSPEVVLGAILTGSGGSHALGVGGAITDRLANIAAARVPPAGTPVMNPAVSGAIPGLLNTPGAMPSGRMPPYTWW